MSQELSNWYRDNFHKLSESPEDEVWKNISSRLDASTTKRSKGYFIIRYFFIWTAFSISTLLTFLIYRYDGSCTMNRFAESCSAEVSDHASANVCTSDSKWINTHLQFLSPSPVTFCCMGQSIRCANTQENGSSAIAPVVAELELQPLPMGDQIDPDVLIDKTNKVNREQISESITAANNTDVLDQLGSIRADTDAFLFKRPNIFCLMKPMTTVAPALSTLRQDSARSTEPSSRCYVGVYGNIKNSYLLNDQTYSGFSRRGFDQTHVVFTPGFGIRYGYKISSAFDLEMQMSFRDQFSQRYTIYEEGKIHEETVALNGYSVSVVGRFRSGIILNRSLYLVGGGQCLFVRNIIQNDSRFGALENNYQRVSPLLSLGAEQEVFGFRGFDFLVGLRTNVGISNIISRPELLSSDLTKTRLSDVSIYFSIQRSFIGGK